jgi:hypothetical protein
MVSGAPQGISFTGILRAHDNPAENDRLSLVQIGVLEEDLYVQLFICPSP